MEDQITEQPDVPLVITADPNTMLTIIGILVTKLGGKVELLPKDFMELNGKMMGEKATPESYTLEVVDARVFGPGPASLN